MLVIMLMFLFQMLSMAMINDHVNVVVTDVSGDHVVGVVCRWW